MNMERRNYDYAIELEERSIEETQSIGLLKGYIARFNSDSLDLGGFIERINPGAFAESLASKDVVALIGHDHNVVVGRKSSGTLRLREDSQGLAFEIDLPDTQAARDLKTLGQRGDLLGCSFGFTVQENDLEFSKRGRDTICTLKRVNLIEVSVGVAFPAYPASSMSVRCQEFAKNQENERARAKARLEFSKSR